MARQEYDTFSTPDTVQTYTVDDALEKIGSGRFQLGVLGVCGWVWMADAIEIMVLSLLGPVLECDWGLLPWQQASINTAMLGGLLVGGVVAGTMADLYGRQKTLLFSCIFATIYGLLSSASPTFWWLVLLRGTTGIFLGGILQSVNYTVEVSPTSLRAKIVPPQISMFAVGSILTVLFAMLTVDALGWRWWLVMCSLPVFIGIFLVMWLPESPRYSIAAGKQQDAIRVLERIAQTNRGELPPGQLTSHFIGKERANIYELFGPELRRLFLQCILNWVLFAFLFYGVAIYSTELIRLDSLCVTKDIFVWTETTYCSLQCQRLTQTDYFLIVIINVGDIVFFPVTIFLLDYLGRKATFVIGYAVHGISLLVMILFCLPRVLLVIFLLTAKISMFTVTQTINLYQAEAFPTHIRYLAFGIAFSCSRAATLLTPFVAQVLMRYSPRSGLLIYFAAAAINLINTALLPLETRGRNLEHKDR